MNMIFVQVEKISGDKVSLRITLNDRQNPDKEIFSSEIFTLSEGDSWSVNNIDATFNSTRTLSEHQ